MPTIHALNAPTSPRQQPYRVTIWGGSENLPGVRAEWIIYSTAIQTAIGLAARAFRRGPAKNRRFTDWTVNVEPVRADEVVIPVPAQCRPVCR